MYKVTEFLNGEIVSTPFSNLKVARKYAHTLNFHGTLKVSGKFLSLTNSIGTFLPV